MKHIIVLTVVILAAGAARAPGQAPAPAPAARGLPQEGLVAFWAGEGNAADSVGKNHGVLKGGATFAPGKMGRAFTFDGKDDHVSMGDALDWGKGSWSISLWVRKSASCAKNATLLRKSLTSHGTPSASGYGLDIVDNRLRFYVAGPNESNPATTGAPGPVAGRWHHVAGVLDRETGKMHLYVDGKATDSASIAKLGSLDTNMPLSMGMLARGNPSLALYHFTGAIDEVAMWNRALSAEEVRGVYVANPLAHPVTVGLVGLWLGDGDGKDHLRKNDGKADQTVAYAADRHGMAKGAFLFDKSGGHVTVPDRDALDTDTAFTISAWVKSKTNHGHLFVKWGTALADYSLQLSDGGRAVLIVCDENMKQEKLITGEALVVDRWTHVAATFDRGVMTIYIDGKRRAAKTSATVKSTSTKEHDGDDVTIGGHSSGGAIFRGAIDEPALWNRALSAEEIAQVARARSLADLLSMTVPHVDRDTLGDRVVLTDGKVLAGTILNDAYELTAFFGKIKLPAGHVVGFVRTGLGSEAFWLLLTDGQAVSGKLSDTVVRLKPAGASAGAAPLSIPLADVTQCAYGISRQRPARATPPGPMLHLRDGHRLCLTPIGAQRLGLKTPYGRLDLPINALLRLDPISGKTAVRRIVLTGGSTLSGVLASEKLPLKIAFGTTVTLERGNILRVVVSEASPGATDHAVMLMRNGDRLVGKLGGKELTVRTRFGKTTIWGGSVLTMVFDATKPGAVAMTLWDGSSLDAVLVEPTVTFALAGGAATVRVSPAHVRSITCPYAVSGPDVLARAKKLIAQLAAESYADRETATKELLKMGKGIAGLLGKHANSPDPEVRQRIEGILGQIDPKKPTPAAPPNVGARDGPILIIK